MGVDVESLVTETAALLEQLSAHSELPPFPPPGLPSIRLTGPGTEGRAGRRPGASPAPEA
jgi:hypothetical protein